MTLFATERNPASAYRAFIGEQREAGRRVVLAAAEDRDLKLLARRAGNAAAERPRTVSGWEQVLGARPARCCCCAPISTRASCGRKIRPR